MKITLIPPSGMFGALLDALYRDLADGRVSASRTDNPLVDHYFTGPWRGVQNVAIRYDCVIFYTEKGSVEARISRLPVKQADQVFEIWMFVSPDFEDLTTIWRAAVGGQP